MNYYLVVAFSSSIFIAAIIGLVRFYKTDPSWRPFIFFIWIGSVNEVLSFLMSKSGIPTAYNNNAYMLLEAMLLVWQFRNWGIFGKQERLFSWGLGLLFVCWLVENILVVNPVNLFYFNIAYCLGIVLMAIQVATKLIVCLPRSLYKSPEFLLCSVFIIYFSYRILIEAFWVYGLQSSKALRNEVFIIMTWVNFFANIMYSIALLWIPKKPQYIMLQ